MKKPRFSDSQILAILKQAEAGSGVPDLCPKRKGVGVNKYIAETAQKFPILPELSL